MRGTAPARDTHDTRTRFGPPATGGSRPLFPGRGRRETDEVARLLTIGDFSRVTHLSVKALRHYDEIGLLEPAQVDSSSGYRRYATAQIPVAQVIRRFRDLDMPLEEIRAVLHAPDADARDRALVTHLRRMEATLRQTRASVASLRALLDGAPHPPAVECVSVPATRAVGIRDRVDWDATELWLGEAFDELHRAITADVRAGPDAALYDPGYFETHEGEVVAFVPVAHDVPAGGRVDVVDIPAARLAVTVHRGAFSDLDQAYGAVGAFVAERMLSAPGPIRERYLVTERDTTDPTLLATEVGWPIRTDDPRDP